MNAIDAFGHFILALFRRPPKPVPAAPDTLFFDAEMAVLKRELEKQIERDDRAARRWGDHG